MAAPEAKSAVSDCILFGLDSSRGSILVIGLKVRPMKAITDKHYCLRFFNFPATSRVMALNMLWLDAKLDEI